MSLNYIEEIVKLKPELVNSVHTYILFFKVGEIKKNPNEAVFFFQVGTYFNRPIRFRCTGSLKGMCPLRIEELKT